MKLGWNPSIEKIADLLNNQATFGDNMNAAIVEIPLCVHGSEILWKSPLKSRPIGFWPLTAIQEDGTRLQFAGDPLFNDLPLGGDGKVKQGHFSITPHYELNHTQPCLKKYHSTTESVANNATEDVIDWDSTARSVGSVISVSAGIFTVSEAGSYLVTLTVPWQAGVTYTDVAAYISSGGVLTDLQTFLPAPFTNGPVINCAGVLNLAAGGTFKARVYQQNAAALARTILGGATTGKQISVQRIYNDSIPSATIKGILVGG